VQRSTIWAQVQSSASIPDGVWIVPIPADASVDRSSFAWLNSLEFVSAPRMLPPSQPLTDPNGNCNLVSKPTVETTGELLPTCTLTQATAVSDIQTLEKTILSWGFKLDEAGWSTLKRAESSGYYFLALHLSDLSEHTSTTPIRIVSAQQTTLPLFSNKEANPSTIYTTYLLGSRRASLGLNEMSFNNPKWNSSQSTNYLSQSEQDLTYKNSLAFVEVASSSLMTKTTLVAKTAVPSVIDSYIKHVSYETTLPIDAKSEILQSLQEPGTYEDPCPRNDLVTLGDWKCSPVVHPHKDPNSLAYSVPADDLPFAFADGNNGRWLTRIRFASHDSQPTDELPVSFSSTTVVNLAYAAGYRLDLACDSGKTTPGSSGNQGAGGAPAGGYVPPDGNYGSGSYGSGDPYQGSNTYTSSDNTIAIDSGDGCSGSSDPDPPDDSTSDSCSGDSSGDSSSDGCSGDSTDDTSDDGCSGDSTDSSDDGCSGDSSGDSSSDSCSGDSSSSEGCSSSDSSSSGCSNSSSSSDGCSIRHKRSKRIKFSSIIMWASVLGFGLRRTRSKRLAQARQRLAAAN
jgi:hypothetical protein